MMYKKMGLTMLVCGLTALPAYAVTVEELDKKIQKINEKHSADNDRLRINGFASFGMAQSDSSDSYHNGVSETINFQKYTKLGVQMAFKIDDDTSVITQLVSKGTNGFDTKAEWLYIKHDFSDNLTGKMGRLRKPNYMLSEFLDVGYAMPWVQAPVEVYGVLEDSANYEAVDLTYGFDVMDWTSSVQVQYGRSVTDTAISDDLVALNFTMNKDALTFRVGYSQADAKLVQGTDLANQVAGINAAYQNTDKSSEVLKDSNKGTFMGVAVAYDDGQHLAMSEFNTLEVDSLYPDQQGYYAMYGYRVNQVMPYVTYAHNETTDDSTRNASATGNPIVDGGVAAAQAAFNKDQTRYSAGVRYDYKPGVALKVQYDMVDTKDTIGEFDAFPSDGKTNVISFVIDTVF